MSYLLDTNACIALMKGAPVAMRDRLERETRAGKSIGVPSIVAFELWYGVAKSWHRTANEERLIYLFGGIAQILPFDEADARAAGEIRAALEAAGRPIGAYDVLIAGQALARDLILVTSDHREFARVKGLRWEDWARAV